MKSMRILFAVLLATLILSAPFAQAAFVPATLSYQGTLNNADDTPVTGLKKLTFKLYKDATGGTRFWEETQDNVYVTNGRFATVFGAATAPANPLNPADFTADVYLGITVGVTTDTEMTPRQKMTGVAFAFNATNATTATTATNGVPAGGIIMWSGATAPAGWALCDGSNSTPDLRDKFIIGASSTYAAGTSGGNKDHFHKGFGDGGDLRAAIGSAYNQPTTIQFTSTGLAVNPNDDASENGTYTIGASAGYYTVVGQPYSHYTKVLGYTSYPYTGTQGKTGSAVAGSLPPYYALAYIMKL